MTSSTLRAGPKPASSELAEALGRVMGVEQAPEFGPERKATPVYRRLAEVQSAERSIGFKSQVSLEDGLRQLVQWWSKETGTPVNTQVAATR